MIFTHLIFTMVFTTVDGEEIPNNHLGFITPFTFRGETTNLNWLAGFLPSTVFHLHPPIPWKFSWKFHKLNHTGGIFFYFYWLKLADFPQNFPKVCKFSGREANSQNFGPRMRRIRVLGSLGDGY